MIRSIGYESNRAILKIEFKINEAIWEYYDFPKTDYFEFKTRNSKGKHFLANIKGLYAETQVR